MSFSEPKKNASGHYAAIAQERRLVQLNAVTLLSNDDTTGTVTLTETETSKIGEVDSFVIQSAKDNCEAWFKKVLPDKIIEAAYIRTSDIMSVPYHSGGVKCYKNRQEVDLVMDPSGTVCDVVLEFSGVIFSKKNFRSIWKLVQVRYRPEPKMPKKYDSYLFQGDDDELLSGDEEL